jgi:hypothetical protein
MTCDERVALLTRSVHALERRAKYNRMMLFAFVAVGSAALLIVPGAAKGYGTPLDQNAIRKDSTLILRELVIVDSAGTPRLRIAAPLPDPIMLGKRFNRGGAVSGIIIYDAEGNERGGYVTGDESRGAALTLDEIMRAAVHIGVNDRGESHVSVDNGLGGYGLMGINQRDGAFIRLHGGGKVTVIPDTVTEGASR